jgi:hypothetical protein
MGETYMVELTLEGDEIDWTVFYVDKSNVWEAIDTGTSAVYGDALLDAGRVLADFMPDHLS